jgi:hypothetical protein
MLPLVQLARHSIPIASCDGRASCLQRQSLRAATLAAIFLAFAAALCPVAARAQDAPPAAIGRVEGADVSVEGGAPADNGTLTNSPAIFVTNGGVVTVHSGHARFTLTAGGQVDICGPAKFTVLQSSAAITLALNFGRLRVQLPASTALRVFTATIIATPLDISGAARDITVGLELNDSLCVIAATGALQLEHQFTGEKLVVPQAGEFFLAAGKLIPVAGTPGSCQCLGPLPRPAEPVQQIPETGLTTPPIIAEPPTPSPNSAADKTPAPLPPPVEFSVPAHANESHPVAPPAKDSAPPPPAVSIPDYKIIAPPLTFSASSPAPPPDPTPDMILLVRTAQVYPDWQFTGHVDAPRLDSASPRAHASQPPAEPAANSQKKKSGFWASVKHFFGGG